MRRISTCTSLRSCLSSAPSGSSIKQDVGLDHHGAGESDALLLPSRKAAHRRLREVVETHGAQRLAHQAFSLGARDLAHPQAVRDVLEHVEMREQGVVLEDHARYCAASAAAP